jgi:UDP-N-acetyl-D-glucosamine dehydrogenase
MSRLWASATVGLPLSIQLGRSGVNVPGLDIDFVKVEALNEGRSYIKRIASETVIELKKAGRFFASTDFSRVKQVGAL